MFGPLMLDLLIFFMIQILCVTILTLTVNDLKEFMIKQSWRKLWVKQWILVFYLESGTSKALSLSERFYLIENELKKKIMVNWGKNIKQWGLLNYLESSNIQTNIISLGFHINTKVPQFIRWRSVYITKQTVKIHLTKNTKFET